MCAIIEGIPNLAPYIVVEGDIMAPKQAFAIVDKKVLFMVKFEDIPFILMSLFFVFNVCYPRGCTNFYSFMEIVTLNYPIDKASPTVKHFLSSIDSVC